jgi:phage shock protein PspC (stress-responsive transcriptional regulator)
MQKVVSISLNGNSYQLEEPGYEQLRAYLERAEQRLKDSPDRGEVMADLEQAIGEKCRSTLGPHKTVVSSDEVARIIADMGPVESPDGRTAEGDTTGPNSTFTPPPSSAPRKRLFKIREGEMWAGVCNGLAAYLGLDVTWVRIGAVILTLFTGVTLLVYIAMWLIVPYAETAEDRAAAFGVPFNTEDILNRAKKNFNESNERWHREWRRQQKHWNRQFRHMSEQLRQNTAGTGQQLTPIAKGALLLFVPIAAILGAVFFVGWLVAMFSLITQHHIFGWSLPHGVPMWVGIIGLVVLYVMVTGALGAVRQGGYQGHHPGWRFLHSLVWLAVTLALLWGVYHIVPGVREVVDSLMWAANLTVTTISETIA